MSCPKCGIYCGGHAVAEPYSLDPSTVELEDLLHEVCDSESCTVCRTEFPLTWKPKNRPIAP